VYLMAMPRAIGTTWRVVQSVYLCACIAIWVWGLGATPDPLINAWSSPVRAFMTPMVVGLTRVEAWSNNPIIVFMLQALIGMVGLLLLPGLVVVGIGLSVAWLCGIALILPLLAFGAIVYVLWDFGPPGRIIVAILGIVCIGTVAARLFNGFRGQPRKP
jgi:hypothetical protein